MTGGYFEDLEVKKPNETARDSFSDACDRRVLADYHIERAEAKAEARERREADQISKRMSLHLRITRIEKQLDRIVNLLEKR